MSARTVVVVTCNRRGCDATYDGTTAWAEHEAWLSGWSKRYVRRRVTRWIDLCPDHSAHEEPQP